MLGHVETPPREAYHQTSFYPDPQTPILSRWPGLPHSSLGSSEPSPQSSSPSHFQRAGMQRPESLQRNSSTPQVIWAARHSTVRVRRSCPHQSCPHWARVRQPREGRSVCQGNGATEAVRENGQGATGNSLQLAGSSLPSTQSLSLSQTQTRGMQRLVMEHWNWLGAQVTSAARWDRERGPYPLSSHSFGPYVLL